jgi:hypothetical protein
MRHNREAVSVGELVKVNMAWGVSKNERLVRQDKRCAIYRGFWDQATQDKWGYQVQRAGTREEV